MDPSNSNNAPAAPPSKDAVFRAFDSYPWTKDRAFQELLSRGLFAQPDAAPAEVALACRIQRFADKVGVSVDADAYRAYRAAGDRPQVDLVPPFVLEQERREEPVVAQRKYAALAGDGAHVPPGQGPEGEASGNTPAGNPPGAAALAAPLWQLAAPKADLYISKDDAATGEAGKEPYPKKFEEIIEFLQSGQEIPGIQKIPDTVISDPSISTTSGRPVPLKPWEKRAAAAGPNPVD